MKPEQTKGLLTDVAKHYGRGKTGVDLAKKWDCSRQYVNFAANYLRKQGVKIPHIRVHTGIVDAAEALKKENPGLFKK